MLPVGGPLGGPEWYLLGCCRLGTTGIVGPEPGREVDPPGTEKDLNIMFEEGPEVMASEVWPLKFELECDPRLTPPELVPICEAPPTDTLPTVPIWGVDVGGGAKGVDLNDRYDSPATGGEGR